jgi:NADH-quinone oxidoreductase subunit F
MKASGLRGRGGAGFPTGMKWSFVPKQSAKPKYVLVNGDESEPGTCKDHLIFLHDPHAVIEGTMIAGLAIGAKMGFIYLRGEYRYLLKIVEKAVADAYAKGFLGKNIFGSGRRLRGHHPDRRRRLRSRRRVGADGVARRQARRAAHQASLPCRRRPLRRPHGHQQRRDHRFVPHILLMGGEAYAKLGSERNGGTRLFGISGHVERPGVYELPMGYNLKKMIYEVAGGIKGGNAS